MLTGHWCSCAAGQPAHQPNNTREVQSLIPAIKQAFSFPLAFVVLVVPLASKSYVCKCNSNPHRTTAAGAAAAVCSITTPPGPPVPPHPHRPAGSAGGAAAQQTQPAAAAVQDGDARGCRLQHMQPYSWRLWMHMPVPSTQPPRQPLPHLVCVSCQQSAQVKAFSSR